MTALNRRLPPRRPSPLTIAMHIAASARAPAAPPEQSKIDATAQPGAHFAGLVKLPGMPDDGMADAGSPRSRAISPDAGRGEANDRLRSIMAPRLIVARELAGMHQGEAARRLEYSNATQIAMWEGARRLIPASELIRVAKLYSVSADYLLGLTNEPDHDPARGLRVSTVRTLRGLLDSLATGVVDAVANHARLVGPDAVCARNVLASGQALVDALGVLMRQPEFEEVQGGATVARTAMEFEARLHEVRRAVENFDRVDLEIREMVGSVAAANDAEAAVD